MGTLGRSASDIASALHSGTGLLTADGTVDSMICHLLSNMAEQSGAHDAVLWRYDFGADRYEFVVASSASSRGGPRERSADGAAEWAQGLYPPHSAAMTEDASSVAIVGVKLYPAEILDSAAEHEPARRWRLLRGTRSLAVVPLCLGHEQIAAVSLAFKDDDPASHLDVGFTLCLANPIVVALAVGRLSTAPGTEPAPSKDGASDGLPDQQTAIKVAHVVNEIVDAAGELHDIDQLVPSVLRVVSRAMGIRQGAMWECGIEGPMHLRYWIRDGSVLSPREFLELQGDAGEQRPLPTYEVTPADRDVGASHRGRHPQPWIVHHAAGLGRTELAALLQRRGSAVELHAPLFIQGIRIGALSTFRPAAQTFSKSQIDLADLLARRLALALQVSRVASRTRVATVARERLAMVNRASDTLRRTADKLAEVPAVEPFLEQMLESLVDTFNGSGGSLYWSDKERVILSLDLQRGSATRLSGSLHPNSAMLQNLLHSSSKIAARLESGVATVVDRRVWRSEAALHDWMESLGVHTLLVVPLNLGGRSFGCLSVRLADSRSLGEEDVELAKALSTQAALAMELTRLAEEAKDKATAEARSAELMKANDALRSTLDVVASGAETDVVLSHALRVIAEQFTSSRGSATLWLADDEGRVQRPHLAFEDNATVAPALSRFVAADRFVPLETDPLFTQHFVEGHAFAVATDSLKTSQADLLRTLGVRSVVTLPMSLRGRPVGSFVVYVPADAPEPSCERMELAQALAHQATLVLQLTRLAEQAKRAAVASERESAALLRAAELTEANAALKRSLDVLASDADLDRFLGILLREIGRRVGADRVILYFEEEVGRGCSSRLSWSDSDGVAKDAGALLGHAAAGALLRTVHSFTLRRLPHVHVVGDASAGSPEERAALRKASIAAILHLPLVLGERCLGAVAVLMPIPRQLPSEELELVQAFAHQATLALHLARLSAQSQSVAILQERARFAQEIHDGIVQSFIGISMQLNQMRGESCPARERAAQLAEYGLAEARRAVKALRPLQLVSKSFTEAVTDIARAVIGSSATVKVTSTGDWEGLLPDTENHLFRMVQEAVNNINKHAKASKVSIELSSNAAEMSVLVSDNGIGFDVDAQGADRGFGLFSMHQRAHSIGAKLAVVSVPGHGTQVFVSLDRSAAQLSE